MQEIVTYKANDGTLFYKKEDCIQYEINNRVVVHRSDALLNYINDNIINMICESIENIIKKEYLNKIPVHVIDTKSDKIDYDSNMYVSWSKCDNITITDIKLFIDDRNTLDVLVSLKMNYYDDRYDSIYKVIHEFKKLHFDPLEICGVW